MIAASFSETGPSSVIGGVPFAPTWHGDSFAGGYVAVSGVNPTDWKARSGATDRAIAPFRIPGQDGAGTIDAVGEGVDAARIGERVWVYFASQGRRWGTAAQFTIVAAERAVPLPDAASFELGACLGIPAMTAYLCLVTDGPVEGRTVLVAGGAGAVGHYAIELARWMGARVIATVSNDEKAAMAEAALHPIPEYARKLHYQASEGHDAWALLPTIKAPTLVIHGSNDQVNMTANAPLLAERIPGAELSIVEGGRHMFFLEFREEAGRVVKEFLARHPLPS